MGKWTRRAFITAGVAAGGVVVFGVAIRRGDRSDKVRGLVAADGESLFDVWLKIAPDNTITAIIPHADMGAHKEFANYSLAREFSAPAADFPAWLIDSVDGLFFRATQMMGLQITGGSLSVRTTGQIAMRVTGAATRAVLLEAAANEWQVPVSELGAGDSMIRHAGSGRFAPAAAALSLPDKPSLKSPGEFRIMGTSPPRFDVPAKVDGSANFGIDASLPGMKYAAVKAAPVFGGRVLDIPGIRKVVDLGDAVAVIADGYWQAKKGLDKLAVEFGDGGNAGAAQDSIFSQFADELDSAAAEGTAKSDFVAGDADAALDAAVQVLEAEYRVPFLAHATMEPMNCTAWVHDDRCELWLGTQNPLGFAQQVAKAIGIDESQVILHNQYLGGGFGRRTIDDFAIQAARIAADSPYPVKLVWSREEDMRHDHYRQASISRFRGGLDASGQPVAWHNHYVNKHDPEEAPHIPYAIADQAIVYSESETHVPWGFWRSVDHSLHAFFTESFIDELAIAAGRDTYEYRRELLAGEPRFAAVLDLAAEKSSWGESLPANMGRGIAIHRSFGTIVAQVVDVEIVNGKPRARRVVCAVDPGYAVHPDNLIAQMESGIAYGLTAALYGEISISGGAVLQSNFHDYRMLRMNEAPAIETYIIDGGGLLGGAGEPGTPPVAPAFTNAIFDATGIRIRELPVSKHELRLKDVEDVA
jgi:isoquinoline 1-oxidoreductase beta subunit